MDSTSSPLNVTEPVDCISHSEAMSPTFDTADVYYSPQPRTRYAIVVCRSEGYGRALIDTLGLKRFSSLRTITLDHFKEQHNPRQATSQSVQFSSFRAGFAGDLDETRVTVHVVAAVFAEPFGHQLVET